MAGQGSYVMNCEEFGKQLQEADLSHPSLSSGMEAHRQDCAACASLSGDFAEIRRQASLLPEAEPSGQVWQRIHQQIREEGLIQAPAPLLFSPAAKLGWFPRLQMGMAYAAMFLVGLGVVYLYSIGTTSPVSFQEPPSTVAQAPAEQSPAVSPPLPGNDEPILELIAKAPPAKRDTYVTNLNRVNSSIHQLSTFLEENPEDWFAREQLLNVYQQKELLWRTLVNWEEF